MINAEYEKKYDENVLFWIAPEYLLYLNFADSLIHFVFSLTLVSHVFYSQVLKSRREIKNCNYGYIQCKNYQITPKLGQSNIILPETVFSTCLLVPEYYFMKNEVAHPNHLNSSPYNWWLKFFHWFMQFHFIAEQSVETDWQSCD